MESSPLYIHPHVDLVQRLYPAIYESDWVRLPIRVVLGHQAQILFEAHRENRKGADIEFCNYLPRLVGMTEQAALAADISLDDARETIAREHGFPDWNAVETLGDLTPDAEFERAVDAVVCGDIATLQMLLVQEPRLVSARSRFGHRAMLLHYVAANGVEIRRQTTPANAAKIAQLLIDAGADPNATASLYGGEFTTWELAASSAHPAAAGVLDELAKVLQG